MPFVVGVCFTEHDFPRFFDSNNQDLKIGDYCVVELDGNAREVGRVDCFKSIAAEILQKRLFPKIVRPANEKEIRKYHDLRRREQEALALCKRKAEEHGLNMKISSVRFEEKNRKVVFYFTADKRVDFRQLVKDLAANFKARIELWQIGVRDEAKHLDGYGVCGRRLCCSSWITEFKPVSMRMAKDQDILLAPTKLSGLCGRLLCCLAYEQIQYQEMGRDAPPFGSFVQCSRCSGTVVDRNLLRRTLIVKDEENKQQTVEMDEVDQVVIPKNLEKKQKDLQREKTGTDEEADIPPEDPSSPSSE